jgi:hypothetical protein
MTQEEIFEIFQVVHENPYLWLSNLRPFDSQQLSMFACGCEVLLLNGLTAPQIRCAVEHNPGVLDSLLNGKYDRALRVAKALAGEEIYNQIDSHEPVVWARQLAYLGAES